MTKKIHGYLNDEAYAYRRREERSKVKVETVYCDIHHKHEVTVLAGPNDPNPHGIPVGWSTEAL